MTQLYSELYNDCIKYNKTRIVESTKLNCNEYHFKYLFFYKKVGEFRK